MKKRLLSLLLAAMLLVSAVPFGAAAKVTHDNDWAIFEDVKDAPETMQLLAREMLSDERISGPWNSIYSAIVKDKKTTHEGAVMAPKIPTDGNKLTYAKSIASAVETARQQYQTRVASYSYVTNDSFSQNLNNFVENLSSTEQDVLYVSLENNFHAASNYEYNLYGLQLFYDFKIVPLADQFSSVKAEKDDTLQDLLDKGIQYTAKSISGGDASSVQVINASAETNTVGKEYQYAFSETTSIETSHSYNAHLGGSTSLGVTIGFKIPAFGGADSNVTVTQTVDYSRDITDTYTTGTQTETSRTITDAIQMELPPHTFSKIEVSNSDSVTKIPYKGASTITYKTMMVYFGAEMQRNNNIWKTISEISPTAVTFGDDKKVFSAIEDLDDRIVGASPGYDKDKLDQLMKDTSFIGYANKLCTGQPYAPYVGDLTYTLKTTTITPGSIQPLYPAQRFVVNDDQISLYTGQSITTKSFAVDANNVYGVTYYGFNQFLHGNWMIVDANGAENTEYAQLVADANGYQEIKALKATNGADIYLTYVPNKDKFLLLDEKCVSEKIPLAIKEPEVTTLGVSGEFAPIILGDTDNTTDVSNLKVNVRTAQDASWQEITGSDKIEWHVEEFEGITVDKAGNISFSKPGTYQIYAMMDGEKSNPVSLQVLPERKLASFSLSGEIPILIWNGTPSSYNLSQLSVSGSDNYGDPFAVSVNDINWRSSTPDVASVAGDELTGEKLGGGFVSASLGDIHADNQIAFTVRDIPVPAALEVSGEIPTLYFDDADSNSFDFNTLTVTANDQYGEAWADMSTLSWYLAEDDTEITDGILTANRRGTYTVYAKCGDAKSDPIAIEAKDSIDSLSANPADLAAEGGEITVTLTGHKVSGAEVVVLNGSAKIASGIAGEDGKAKVNIPENMAKEAAVYTVKARLQGMEEFAQATTEINQSGRKDLFPFTDVYSTDWYYDDVYYTWDKKLVNGMTDTRFGPSGTMTRAMLITVLGRAAEVDTQQYAGASYSDVPVSQYYAPYVKWASENGIVEGVGNDKFAPSKNVTREQVAVILYRYAVFMGKVPQGSITGELDYLDAGRISGWAKEGALFTQANGIISGRPGKLFDPQGTAKRGEVAAILHRYLVKFS